MQDRGVEQKGGEADGGHALVHEVGNDTVEVQPIVETAVGQIDEIGCGDRHLLEVDLTLDHSKRGVESGDRVGHG